MPRPRILTSSCRLASTPAPPDRDTVWRAAFAYAPDRKQLAALGPRTLLVRGDQSPVAMLRLVDALHGLMPESTLEVIAGANHLLPLTRAQDVTKAIVSHLHADAERHLR